MLELWNKVVWALVFLRDQCMPVTIGDAPGTIDFLIVALAALAMVVGSVWFALGLMGRDPDRMHAIKSQVLED
ncbi:MAG: hypothetical protein OIF40_03200 [Mangrovicoccus sp.]|nr:hypothetical protein [Mangrovicoccus sp.]